MKNLYQTALALCFLWGSSAWALPGFTGRELDSWIQQFPQLATTLHAEEYSYLGAQMTLEDGRLLQVLMTGSVFNPEYFVKHIQPEGKVEKVVIIVEFPTPFPEHAAPSAWAFSEAQVLLKKLYPWMDLNQDLAWAKAHDRLLYQGREYWSRDRGVSRYKMDTLLNGVNLIGVSRFYEGRKYVYEISLPVGISALRLIVHNSDNARRDIQVLKHNENLYRKVHPGGARNFLPYGFS